MADTLIIQDIMDVLATEEGPFKNEDARVVIKRSPIVRLCSFL